MKISKKEKQNKKSIDFFAVLESKKEVRFSQEPVNIEDTNQTKLETNESLDTIQSFQNA
jgi:hypothetical protein